VQKLRPFERLPFEALPARPARAHAYFDMVARDVVLESRPFGSHRVHVRELGSGPPLLLLHGLMTSGYSWRFVVAALAERFRVVVPDLVGAGRSDKPDREYTPLALATWIGELADTLGIAGCPVVGNSLGGYLCLHAALEQPKLASRIVNIHSPGIVDARLRALSVALKLPGARALVAALARRDPERWAHRNVHYFDERLKSREEAREYGAPLASPEGSRAFVRYLAETIAPAPMAELVRRLEARRESGEPFPVPLLLVYARRDPMVPPYVGERLHALIPSAELRWLDDSSHFAQVDSPDELVALIRNFVS
jgi:pimeloyl-ACP methyl ester carboxylesterase